MGEGEVDVTFEKVAVTSESQLVVEDPVVIPIV